MHLKKARSVSSLPVSLIYDIYIFKKSEIRILKQDTKGYTKTACYSSVHRILMSFFPV